jgi:serine protease
LNTKTHQIAAIVFLWLVGCAGLAPAAEWNPVRQHPVQLGTEMRRVVVGFRATPGNSVTQTFLPRTRAQAVKITQARTSGADVAALAKRAGLALSGSRQLTPSMHVMFLSSTLYGTAADAALAKLRADTAVKFADVDQRRYPHALPNDPLFVATSGATGQWYMQTPSSATGDLSATDAVSAWNLTTGSTAVVIADVDTGVRFDHPDLLRAGLAGRLLPGYDFVGGDMSPTTGAALGTFLVANDGDGWDPDPSDPGDWISTTDQENSLFPSSSCPVEDSSWHGTRVVGIMGALTNNNAGIAGMTWNSWILPVRALGKCGGYDSDIIAGMEWAAGVSVSTAATPVPDNPYPANIINLSLGGSSSCPSDYEDALKTVTSMGVLVVISAGNASGAVEAPANCSALVTGVIAVAGLRNVGTKVGYSSFGAEVDVAAPAGNCINSSGACLRSIDTTFNLGTTVPGANSYTDETNENLGTSFSAPIVSGIAALMRSVNGNLTPAQLASRLESSATAFPANTGNLPVCPSLDSSTDECSCPPSGECGSGMVNALSAVNAALAPIAAVSFPSSFVASGSVVFDASGSAAACNRSIQSYAWSATGGLAILSGAATAKVTTTGTGTLLLTVTDSAGSASSATITVGSTSAATTAPTSAGSTACAAAVSVTPIAPTVTQTLSPTVVGVTVASTLTLTLANANKFALTQSALTDTLPSGLDVQTSPAATTTCTGAQLSLTTTTDSVSLANAVIPVSGSCTVTLTVASATAGTYTNSLAAGALSTGPAGAGTTASSASLSVTAPLAPTVAAAFSPATVGENAKSTLTVTLSNPNAYALTAVSFTETVPTGLTLATSPAPSTTCTGTLSAATSSVTLTQGTIPASGSCTVVLTVSSGTAGSYTNTVPASAVTDAQTAVNAASSAVLTVSTPSSGGGSMSWLSLFVLGGLAWARRGGSSRRRITITKR